MSRVAEDAPAHACPGFRAMVRVTFGVVWAVDAVFKWMPGFRPEILSLVQAAAKGQPTWLAPWFNFWISVISAHQGLVATLTALTETAIALAMIIGFARKTTYAFSGVFALLIWSTAEGFGGPYSTGATDIGAAVIYAVAAAILLALNATAGTSRFSVDALLERRIPWWKHVAEVGRGSRPQGDRGGSGSATPQRIAMPS